jgi:hypothetical protein
MTAPTAQSGLHVRYEKAGLILDQFPIPWNADAVIVEANIRLPKSGTADKQQFTLRLGAGAPEGAELVIEGKKGTPLRVLFRMPTPKQSTRAAVCWRDHALGELDIPIVSAAEFGKGLTLTMPTIHVAIAGQGVACQAFVVTQAKSAWATALLQSATPLAPIIDFELGVDVHRENGDAVGCGPVTFTAKQLRAKQALATVLLPKLKRIGTYELTWRLGGAVLHRQRLRAVSRKTLMRSLRISATRFVVEKIDGTVHVVRSLPHRDGSLMFDDVTRISPCFFVTSGEAGLVGVAPFTLRAVAGELLTTLAIKDDVVISDGPTPLILGTLGVKELEGIKHFTLASGERVLGNLSLLPAPTADFTGEGGFAPLDDFLWSPAADEQLNDRLGKLLEGE